MRFLIIFGIFFFSSALFGQGVLNNLGNGKAAGLNGMNTTFEGIYSLSGNQAGIAFEEKFSAFAFAEQRFLLQELTGVNAGALLPTQSGNFGVSIGYFGFQNLSEQKVGLAYGRKLLQNLSIGGQLDFYNFQTGDFGSASTFTFEFGMQYLFNEQLTIGIHTLNPIRANLNEEEPLTSNFKLGLKYSASRNVKLFTELEKDLNFDQVFKAGLIYSPIKSLEFRTAIATNQTTFSFGLGYKMKNGIGIDLATNYHQILGFTPSAGFVYQVNRPPTTERDRQNL